MNLVEIVALDLLLQDSPHVFEGGELFESTGTNNPILQPTKRAFDLAFGLRRKGLDHIHAQQAQTSAPLRIDLVGTQDLLVPEAIPVPDEAEDSQIVHVVL